MRFSANPALAKMSGTGADDQFSKVSNEPPLSPKRESANRYMNLFQPLDFLNLSAQLSFSGKRSVVNLTGEPSTPSKLYN